MKIQLADIYKEYSTRTDFDPFEPMLNRILGGTGVGSHTPQGLYAKLKQLSDAGGTGASGVTVPLVGFVGTSHGPCQ